MPEPIRLVGQGLGGSLLAWKLERAGIDFEIWDQGHATASTRAGAGLINPVTGQRWVKSWRIDALLPIALRTFAELEQALGETFVFKYQLQRRFVSPDDAKRALEKIHRGELDPFVVRIDQDAVWLAPVYRIDLAGLIAALRRHWLANGKLREGVAGASDGQTIWCVGVEELKSGRFNFVPWRAAKGETVVVRGGTMDLHTIIHAKHWLIPIAPSEARVGATYEPDVADRVCSGAARIQLLDTAREVLGTSAQVVLQTAGVRLTTADKRPAIGWNPQFPATGVCNGLGSKGALFAPFLAESWCNHLREGAAFDPEIYVARFVN